MAVDLVGTTVGAAQSGFTSPSFVAVKDSAPDNNSFAASVTTVGGTPGVNSHTVSKPFSGLFRRPARLLTLTVKFLNGVTNKYSKVPKNVYTFTTRKGVDVVAGQTEIMLIKTTFEVPAGSETFDNANIRGALSYHIGTLSKLSNDIGITLSTGVV